MRILVTGHRGNIGAPVAAQLARLGHKVVGFDRVDGADLLDLAEVRRAAVGCAAIVHLGALAHDTAGSPEHIIAGKITGTMCCGRLAPRTAPLRRRGGTFGWGPARRMVPCVPGYGRPFAA